MGHFSLIIVATLYTIYLDTYNLSNGLPISVPRTSNRNRARARDRGLIIRCLSINRNSDRFVRLPGNRAVLVSTNRASGNRAIIGSVSTLNYGGVACLITARPRSSRVNNVPTILSTFSITGTCLPGTSSSSSVCTRFLSGLSTRNYGICRTGGSISIVRARDLSTCFITPYNASCGGLGGCSTILGLICNRASFLFANSTRSRSRGRVATSISTGIIGINRRNSGASSDRTFIDTISPRCTIVRINGSGSCNRPGTNIVRE